MALHAPNKDTAIPSLLESIVGQGVDSYIPDTKCYAWPSCPHASLDLSPFRASCLGAIALTTLAFLHYSCLSMFINAFSKPCQKGIIRPVILLCPIL